MEQSGGGGRSNSCSFNRDPHFQRVMDVHVFGDVAGLPRFNRDPHFQRVMGESPTGVNYRRQLQ